jgi:hypothetical protein
MVDSEVVLKISKNEYETKKEKEKKGLLSNVEKSITCIFQCLSIKSTG